MDVSKALTKPMQTVRAARDAADEAALRRAKAKEKASKRQPKPGKPRGKT